MLNRTVRNSLLPLLLVAAIAGCSKSGQSPSAVTNPGGGSTSGTQMDQAAVTATMAAEPTLVEDGIAEDPMQTTVDGGGVAGATDAIHPLTFWRRIDHVNRTFEFAFSDTDSTGKPTTALVTVRKQLVGTFNILAGPVEPGMTMPPPDSLNVVHKPLEDHWVRHILLKRVSPVATSGDDAMASSDDPSAPRPIWRIAATSGVQVTSAGATTNIQSVRVQAGAFDTTLTDPLALYRLRRVLRFPADAMVNVTVTTGRADDVVLLYFREMRFRLKNNGDDTYSGTFRAGRYAELRHFAVNALSNGTLFDDTAPYDSQAWIFPYVVEPTELANYMP